MHLINREKKWRKRWSVRNGNWQLGVEDTRSQYEPMQAELKHMQRPRGFKMQHGYKTKGRISKAGRYENKQ